MPQDPMIILTRDEVQRILGACDKVDQVAELVNCPENGLIALSTREKVRQEAEASKRNWMIAAFGVSGASLLSTFILGFKTWIKSP